MDTPTMSSGGGEQGKRMLAVAVRFAGLVVAVAMVVLVFGTGVGEWLQVGDR